MDSGKCIQICKAKEIAAVPIKKLTGKQDQQDVHGIGRSRLKKGKDKCNDKYTNKRGSENNSDSHSKCSKCCYVHGFKCPAYKKKCNNCKGYIHFAKCCKKSKSVYTVDNTQDSESSSDNVEDDNLYFCGVIKTISQIAKNNSYNEIIK